MCEKDKRQKIFAVNFAEVLSFFFFIYLAFNLFRARVYTHRVYICTYGIGIKKKKTKKQKKVKNFKRENPESDVFLGKTEEKKAHSFQSL